MIHKFHSRPNGWEGITPHIYKENPGVFRDVTKQILFDNEADLPVQFRYFQVEKDGFSSLEEHEHMHLVLIFKGKGKKDKISKGDILGFLCLVNHDRDIPVYPTEEELLALKRDPEIEKFLKK